VKFERLDKKLNKA